MHGALLFVDLWKEGWMMDVWRDCCWFLRNISVTVTATSTFIVRLCSISAFCSQ